MKISSKKLLHLAVFTESGKDLGKVSELIIDIDTHQIEQYVVRGSHLIEELFSKELVIGNSQVLSITNERMIVDDSLSNQNKQSFNAKALNKSKSSPTVSL